MIMTANWQWHVSQSRAAEVAAPNVSRLLHREGVQFNGSSSHLPRLSAVPPRTPARRPPPRLQSAVSAVRGGRLHRCPLLVGLLRGVARPRDTPDRPGTGSRTGPLIWDRGPWVPCGFGA